MLLRTYTIAVSLNIIESIIYVIDLVYELYEKSVVVILYTYIIALHSVI